MKILIAEDDRGLASLLEVQVRLWGYEPTLVHDGVSALKALQEIDAPRMALLDWQMPGLDGIEVCRRLRQGVEHAYPYLVLLTGQAGSEAMVAGLEAGADEFLTKPVGSAELRARLGAGRRIVALQEQLREQAARDGLTGLYNRTAVLRILDRELNRAGREHRPLGVVLADLDHFKRINDTLGHLVGDEVLRQTARRMQTVHRPYDFIGRYGGEEFVSVLPGCDCRAALVLAERLRSRIAAEPVDYDGGRVRVTLSLGVMAWEGDESMDSEALLRAADAALYQAKRAGRDRAVLADRFPAPPRALIRTG
jgi:diguanylate cyclase (GGDEF)-like protein